MRLKNSNSLHPHDWQTHIKTLIKTPPPAKAFTLCLLFTITAKKSQMRQSPAVGKMECSCSYMCLWQLFKPQRPILRISEPPHQSEPQPHTPEGISTIGQNQHRGHWCGQQRQNTSFLPDSPWPLQHATCQLDTCRMAFSSCAPVLPGLRSEYLSEFKTWSATDSKPN